MHKPLINRFWEKVDIKGLDECWFWKASLSAKGYGQIKVNGVVVRASRLAFELTNGPIKEGLQALHRCDNRNCCNPSHIYEGTADDNIIDREKRNPVSRELCGVTHTKFTATEVQDIRKLKGTMTQRAAAAVYGITHFTIRMIWTKSEFLCKEGYYV